MYYLLCFFRDAEGYSLFSSKIKTYCENRWFWQRCAWNTCTASKSFSGSTSERVVSWKGTRPAEGGMTSRRLYVVISTDVVAATLNWRWRRDSGDMSTWPSLSGCRNQLQWNHVATASIRSFLKSCLMHGFLFLFGVSHQNCSLILVSFALI